MVFPVVQVASSAVSWISLYFCISLTTGWKSEWICRTITVIHASIVSFLAFWNAVVLGPWPFTSPGGETTPLQEITMAICLGYFLFDLTWCLTHKTEGMVMMLHHATSITFLTVCLAFGESGTETVAAIGGAEITNPILQLRWFLKESSSLPGTSMVNTVEYVFASMFVLIRLLVGSYFLYCVVSHPKPFFSVKAGGLALYVISWLFSAMIVRYLWRKYQRHAASTVQKMATQNGYSNGVVKHITVNGHTNGNCCIAAAS